MLRKHRKAHTRPRTVSPLPSPAQQIPHEDVREGSPVTEGHMAEDAPPPPQTPVQQRHQGISKWVSRRGGVQRAKKRGRRFKGVVQAGTRTYRSAIWVSGKLLTIGYFKRELDAAKAYDAAALFTFGDQAVVNQPDKVDQLPEVPLEVQDRIREHLRKKKEVLLCAPPLSFSSSSAPGNLAVAVPQRKRSFRGHCSLQQRRQRQKQECDDEQEFEKTEEAKTDSGKTDSGGIHESSSEDEVSDAKETREGASGRGKKRKREAKTKTSRSSSKLKRPKKRHTGVSFVGSSFRSRIWVGGCAVSLGRFDTEEAAEKEYDEAAAFVTRKGRNPESVDLPATTVEKLQRHMKQGRVQSRVKLAELLKGKGKRRVTVPRRYTVKQTRDRYRGVWQHGDKSIRAVLYLKEERRKVSLGAFKSMEEAARAYDAAARFAYRDKAEVNFPDEPSQPSDVPLKIRQKIERHMGEHIAQPSSRFPLPPSSPPGEHWEDEASGRKGSSRSSLEKQGGADDHKDARGLSDAGEDASSGKSSRHQPASTRWRFKGVWPRKDGVIRAGLYLKGQKRSLNLGFFSSRLDAARAYDSAAYLAFGNEADLNFPGELDNLPEVPPHIQTHIEAYWDWLLTGPGSGKRRVCETLLQDLRQARELAQRERRPTDMTGGEDIREGGPGTMVTCEEGSEPGALRGALECRGRSLSASDKANQGPGRQARSPSAGRGDAQLTLAEELSPTGEAKQGEDGAPQHGGGTQGLWAEGSKMLVASHTGDTGRALQICAEGEGLQALQVPSALSLPSWEDSNVCPVQDGAWLEHFAAVVDPAAEVWAYLGEDGGTEGPTSLACLRQLMGTPEFAEALVWVEGPLLGPGVPERGQGGIPVRDVVRQMLKAFAPVH